MAKRRVVETTVQFFHTEGTVWTGRGEMREGALWSDAPTANGCSAKWLVVDDAFVMVRKLRARERTREWMAGAEWVHETSANTQTGALTASANGTWRQINAAQAA